MYIILCFLLFKAVEQITYLYLYQIVAAYDVNLVYRREESKGRLAKYEILCNTI